jgi:hypothetical protein
MKTWSKRLILSATGIAAGWLIAVTLPGHAAAQTPAAPAAKGPTAGESFKNVTTTSLKGLTVSDFLGSMGVMAAALGYDCADCHPGAGSDKVDWVFDTPKKKTARKMVDMVATINRTNFGGAQMVTCFTCHHGRDLPVTTIALDTLYGPPNEEKRDIIVRGEGQPSADSILDKYIAAVGGAQKWANIKSWVATGSSLGYEGLGGGGTFSIYAQAPDHRTTQIQFKDHPERGDSTRAYNGTAGWIKSPRGLVPEFEFTGSELEGMRADALTSFPNQIKTAFRNWTVGQNDVIGDKEVYVVQGRNQSAASGMFYATFYFDTKTNLLVREVRFSASPIGRIPTQMDFSDYRDVSGVKFPFKYQFSWLDGRDQFQITDVKTNVMIDAAKFGKP